MPIFIPYSTNGSIPTFLVFIFITLFILIFIFLFEAFLFEAINISIFSIIKNFMQKIRDFCYRCVSGE